MKRKINLHLLIIAIMGILATLIMLMGVFYNLFQKQVIEDLRTYAQILQNVDVSGSNIDKTWSNIRITWIDADGKVQYDSNADTDVMENHNTRPEIIKAVNTGEGVAVRKSSTLEKNAFYYAAAMEDGSVLRVSREADSLYGVLGNAFPVIVGITILLILACMLFAHFLTKSIISPIEDMAKNLDRIEEVDTYKELLPFVAIIKSQHEDIIRNAKLRQDFTANVSHELKTPLTSISGYAELIENGMADEKSVPRFAGEIHANATRLLHLINDIIRLSELDVVETNPIFEKINLYDIAQTCVDMLQMNASNHQVSLKFTGEPCVIYGNKQMLEEVLYNLCDNGIRYNNAGGSVFVSVESLPDGKVELSVKDTGIGISRENQIRIFERFYRVDKSRSKSTGGTGLGLAIVKHIVAQHNAMLELESEEGVGTQIFITFDSYAASLEKPDEDI